MAYDERLAERIRTLLARRGSFVEKQMFGGVAFLVAGRMACGIVKGDLVVRVGPDAYDRALAQPFARPMDFTGREIRGFVFVSPAGLKAGRLAAWVNQAADYAESQPRSESGGRSRARRPRRGRK